MAHGLQRHPSRPGEAGHDLPLEAPARHDEAPRDRAAAELSLPVEHGKVLFPDAQIEYVTAAGLAGRCNVEVASEHYGGEAIRAKAAAGFAMYARGMAAAGVGAASSP